MEVVRKWRTPKTDWKVTYDEETGKYIGDYFNLEDFFRIQNNMFVLYERCCILYPYQSLITPSEIPETYSDSISSSVFKIFADCLNQYCVTGANIPFDDYMYFYNLIEGDNFPNYEKLNSLEKTMLLCYEQMNEFIENRRQFKWRLGIEGGTKKWL